MTLIIGLNLSDRLYLVADTRCTRKDPNGKVIDTQDNLYKIIPLAEVNDHTSKLGVEKCYIAIAVAGDVFFAQFVYRQLKEQLEKKELSYDIRELYEMLNDEWATEVGTKWHKENNRFNIGCAVMFAGTFSPRNKKISINRVNELVETFHKYANRNAEDSDIITEENISMIPFHFAQAAINKSDELVEMPDSLIFCTEIRVLQFETKIKKYKAEWGEFLARGTKTTQDNLPPDLLARCELMLDRVDANAITKIAETIRDKSKNIMEIGGPILSIVIKKNSFDSRYFNKETKVENGKTYLKNRNGVWKEGIFFTDYRDEDMNAAWVL